MKLANRANPTHSEAMLVRSRAGLALAAMSTSGEATRRSISTKETSRTAATASSPIVRGAPQPHTAASLSGSSRQNKATASRIAPGRSNRPTRRWAGSVRNSQLPSSDTTPPAIKIQNSRW